MRAMVLDAVQRPLRQVELPIPRPAGHQLLLRVRACGVCRTDLHIVDGELSGARLPLVLGHQIVATVAEVGTGVAGFEISDRVGVPWLGSTCGACGACLGERENLCDEARFTGHHLPGGYAEYTVADHRFCFLLPSDFGDLETAPLLCAGLIGYRALRMAGDPVRHDGEPQRIGFYGFGSAAHILAQVVRHQGRRLFAFTRKGDEPGQAFARNLGAEWAGASGETPPEPLDAAIIFAPVGELVPAALGAVALGGVVVCAGIHMSDIPSFPYELLWGERSLRSVANLTRRDAEEFLPLAAAIPIRSTIKTFPLDRADEALGELRAGLSEGSAVLVVDRRVEEPA